MTWAEFCSLLSGLGEDSPLVRMVRIRLEDDPAVLKHFTTAQHRIRDEWRSKAAFYRTPQETADFYAQLEAIFAGM